MAEWEMVDREYHGHYYCWIGWLLLAFIGNERLRKEAWRRRRPSARTEPKNSHRRLSSNQNYLCFSAPVILYQLNHPERIWGKCLSMFTTYWYIHSVCRSNKLTESSHLQSLGLSLLCIKRPFSDSLRAPFGIWNEFHTGNLYITA